MWGSKDCIAKPNSPLRKTFHGVSSSYLQRNPQVSLLLCPGEAISASGHTPCQDGPWGPLVWVQVGQHVRCLPNILWFGPLEMNIHRTTQNCIIRYPCLKLQSGVCHIKEVPFRQEFDFFISIRQYYLSQRLQLYRCCGKRVPIQQGGILCKKLSQYSGNHVLC